MFRLLKTAVFIAILVIGGYLIYTNFIREDPCTPPPGAPAAWEPSTECLESRGTIRYQP